jgi:uncharacterized lipoprotein
MKISRYLLFFIILEILFTIGCGLQNDVIEIQYTPYPRSDMINGADAVSLYVYVIDKRKVKENVGKKGYEYDFLGEIIAKNSIPDTIVESLEYEFKRRGFRIEKGSVDICVELSKFYNNFHPNGDCEAEFIMIVKVINNNGKDVFITMVEGEGSAADAMMRTGENAKIALESAMEDAISKLMKNEELFSSIFGASL